MKKSIFLLLAAISIITTSFSQDSSEEFKPNGKPVALIFTNFNMAFEDGETKKAFEITRAYLGYEYNFSKEWYAKIILDVGDPKIGAFQSVAYLKNAYVQYNKNKFTASAGMISTTQFKVSEKTWGLRYIEKSFQDAYKFNSSADLGFNLDYEFADFISADFSIINGEGYKVLQNDNYVRPGLGVTVTPLKNIVARVFVDNMGDSIKQQSLATFLAYKGKRLVVGAEYNYQKNYDMADGQDQYGTSFYATYKAADKFLLFGRFDDLKSKSLAGENNPWNYSNDGQLIMAGVEYSPIKGVKIAPNYRYWGPADDTMPATSFIYFNLELKF
jgi:hypothetical protein